MQSFRIKLSTPKFLIISTAIAVDALPEIGLIIISGKISGGIWKTFKIGKSILPNKSRIPEFLKALIARNNPTKVGNILMTVWIPSLEPF